MITCGTISGGYGYNVIADKVTITGTTRSFTKATQELIKTRMCDMCCGVASMYGGKIDLNYTCESNSTVRHCNNIYMHHHHKCCPD